MLDDRSRLRGRSAASARLPDFSVRTSTRARRVRLTVSAHEGLVVVVPPHFRGDPAELVASKRVWAERALASVADKRALHLAGAEALLPSDIPLPAIDARFRVEYVTTPSASVSARTRDDAVVVSGDVADADKCLAALRRWLHRTASDALTARCYELACVYGLHPATIAVSAAHTRWGSCSSHGRVMLSRNLLFLPPDLVDALILHELAHLRVLDHSPRFWSLLATLDPAAMEHRAALRRAADAIPGWADVR